MTFQVYVGMDLGSHKTAVMTSEGRRAFLPTVIGRPKDDLSRRLIKTDAVFGQAAIEGDHSLDLLRPLAHGRLKFHAPGAGDSKGVKDEATQRESLRLIVQHALGLVGVTTDVNAAVVIGAPALACLESKELLVEIAGRTCRSVMVVSEPFAVAYGMDQLSGTLVVDIGAGTTDICALTGIYPRPEHQVTLPIGGDAIDDIFTNLVLSQHPKAIVNRSMLCNLKERFGSVAENPPQADLTVVVDGRPQILNLTRQLHDACKWFVEPVFNGLKQCLSGWDSEMQGRLLRNVILAGGGSRMQGLDTALERLLREYYGSARVNPIHDSMFAGAAGALKLAMEARPEHWNAI